MSFLEYKDTLIKTALDMGALHAVYFDIDQIVFDPRTILKCMFGCSDWGKGHTCPSRPLSLNMEQYKEVFSKYKWGIIIHANDKKTTQEISYKLEQLAFADGYYFAFSLSDCAICKECAGGEDHPCRNVRKARPAFHSVGIDVFKTAKNFDLPIYTLKDESEVQNWYSAIFIE